MSGIMRVWNNRMSGVIKNALIFFIPKEYSQSERLIELNNFAIAQMKSLLNKNNMKKLKE